MRLLPFSCVLAVLLGFLAPHASAQTARVVGACGAPPVAYVAGQFNYQTVDTGGGSCPSGGGAASLPYQATAVATDQLGVGTAAAVGLNPPATATYCLVTVSVAGVNWRADGTSPTTGASGGQPLGLGQFMTVGGPNLMGSIKFINQTASSGALLNISCFK